MERLQKIPVLEPVTGGRLDEEVGLELYEQGEVPLVYLPYPVVVVVREGGPLLRQVLLLLLVIVQFLHLPL